VAGFVLSWFGLLFPAQEDKMKLVSVPDYKCQTMNRSECKAMTLHFVILLPLISFIAKDKNGPAMSPQFDKWTRLKMIL
jgi:hypothetical protein